MTKLESAITQMRQQGADLSKFRAALASYCGVDISVVDAAIAAAGPSRVVSHEQVARERLAEDRRRRHTAAYRQWNGEEV